MSECRNDGQPGVIILRGNIFRIAVLRFNVDLVAPESVAYIVAIILIIGSRENDVVGGSVTGGTMLCPESIRSCREFAGIGHTQYISGLSTSTKQMFVAVDFERLTLSSEMALVDATLIARLWVFRVESLR